MATHTSIAELIKERTDSTQFLEFLQTEQDLVNNQNVHRYLDFIEDAACQDVELLRVFRVMCVQSIIGSGLKPKVLDAYRKMILQVYGHRHLLSLINLEKAGLLTSQGIERAKIAYSNLLSIISNIRKMQCCSLFVIHVFALSRFRYKWKFYQLRSIAKTLEFNAR